MSEKIVYTGGTFDLFHPGHVRLLRSCKRIADRVVVALNSDEFVAEFKGAPPVCSFEDRLEVLKSCKYVSSVVRNDSHDSKDLIIQARANFIVIGSDWAQKDYYAQMGFTQEWLDHNNIQLVYVPYTQHISTTSIKRAIQQPKLPLDTRGET